GLEAGDAVGIAVVAADALNLAVAVDRLDDVARLLGLLGFAEQGADLLRPPQLGEAGGDARIAELASCGIKQGDGVAAPAFLVGAVGLVKRRDDAVLALVAFDARRQLVDAPG